VEGTSPHTTYHIPSTVYCTVTGTFKGWERLPLVAVTVAV